MSIFILCFESDRIVNGQIACDDCDIISFVLLHFVVKIFFMIFNDLFL